MEVLVPDHWFELILVALLFAILAAIVTALSRMGRALELLRTATDELSKITSFLEAEKRDRSLEEHDRIAHYRASARRGS